MTLVSETARRRLRSSRPERAPWEEPEGPLARIGKGLALTAIVLVILGPLYVVLLTSLSSQETITEAGGLVMVPDGLTLDAYRAVLGGGVITRSVLVSTGVTVVGTVISVGLSILCAYGLSRPGSFMHRPLLFTVLLTFLFGPGMIPTYLVVSGLGLVDSYWALILPSAIAAFNVVVLRSFFMSIPQELIDSARIDGAGEFRILASIVLPLSRAVTAVVALFYGVGYWNAFFNALLYIDDTRMWPLQLVLRTFVLDARDLPAGAGGIQQAVDSAPSLALRMAVVMIAVIPILLVYPFVQRHFTKGVIIGAVKG
ncbi:carbohydrate ABC transporter permease [Allostreptomyces psammosilenae]|uniref:Putative aldouronate transport system permease protein n=1 Tax=Allostreptomyces psammosilenae TaxID=1892865 RepID=A0A853A1L8_9ACTN|nr:carbohydrate ABC transporter permease [Allostreptomyces psammosilenae]NYI04412.1 putative aldouronate transport system permease protein [Allostreptomyces psammosilenae]